MDQKTSEYPDVNTGMVEANGGWFDFSQVTAIIISPPSLVIESRKFEYSDLKSMLAVNIYNTNGTLTANRTVNMDGKWLSFQNGFTGFDVAVPAAIVHIEGNNDTALRIDTAFGNNTFNVYADGRIVSLANEIDLAATNEVRVKSGVSWIEVGTYGPGTYQWSSDSGGGSETYFYGDPDGFSFSANNGSTLIETSSGASVLTIATPGLIQINSNQVRIVAASDIYAQATSLYFETGTASELYVGDDTVDFRLTSTSILFIMDPAHTNIKHDTLVTLDVPNVEYLQETADRVAYFDSNKYLKSSTVTTTELGYVSGVSSPIQPQLDALSSGLDWKQHVRFATATGENIDITTGGLSQTIDGALRSLTADDRILLQFQTSATENGIYLAKSGSWVRSNDADTGTELVQATVGVSEGSDNADKKFTCTNDTITIGVTSITWVQVGGTTYVGTTNRITVTGNVIDIAATYMGQSSITTLGTITTGTWNGTIVSPIYGGTGVNNGASTITLGGSWSQTGSHTLGLTTTANTALNLPVTGTLATLAGAEALSNKTIDDDNNVIQNLVYTALKTVPSNALKIWGHDILGAPKLYSAPIFLADNANHSVTGTTVNTMLTSLLIPGGTVTPGDTLIVEDLITKTTTASSTLRIYLNTSAAIGGTQVSNSLAAATNTWNKTKRSLFVRSATETMFLNVAAQVFNDETNNANGMTTANINWTNDVYVVFAAQQTNSGDTTASEGATVMIRKP